MWRSDRARQDLRTQQQGAYDITYSYDPAGNRLTQVRTEGGSVTRTTYTYNAANQLTSQVDSSGALSTSTYGANGNLLTLQTGSGLTTYTWDGENRATLVELAAGGRNTMVYDGQGMRRRFAEAAGVHQFVWDEENILAEQDGSGVEQVLYTLAPHGGVYPERSEWGDFLSQRRGSASYFHHYTGLGSTLEVSDATGASVQTYAYDGGEFGGQLSPDPTTDAIGNRLTWVGRQGYVLQADPGTYWLGARIYDPETGRFLSPDPLEGAEGNRYVYASNRPTMLVDPSGMVCTARTGSGCVGTPHSGIVAPSSSAPSLAHVTSSHPAASAGGGFHVVSHAVSGGLHVASHPLSAAGLHPADRPTLSVGPAVGTPSAAREGGRGSSGDMAAQHIAMSGGGGQTVGGRMSSSSKMSVAAVATSRGGGNVAANGSTSGGGSAAPLVQVPCGGGLCCEAPPPGIHWQMPVKGPLTVETWYAEASCDNCNGSASSGPPCTVTYHRKLVPKPPYADQYPPGYHMWDSLTLPGRQCVNCTGQPSGGGGGGGGGCNTTDGTDADSMQASGISLTAASGNAQAAAAGSSVMRAASDSDHPCNMHPPGAKHCLWFHWEAPVSAAEGQQILNVALTMVREHQPGWKYQEGGNTWHRIDCSHFVCAVYQRGGFPSYHYWTASSQRPDPHLRGVSSPQPGDVILWPKHVGVIRDPQKHTFVGSQTHTGPATAPWSWIHGIPHFYRWRKKHCCVRADKCCLKNTQPAQKDKCCLEWKEE